VSISVPCVVGPYTSVSGTLTLFSSKVREKNVPSGEYGDESNYRSSYLPIQSISTSTGQNDSGLFELNFRDERYLPFEGAGAISRWRFKLPERFRAFDYDTISDVILHIRYTARDGGETLQGKAVNNLEGFIQGVEAAGTVRLFSVRHDFPTEWAKFKSAEVDLSSTPKVFAGLTLHLENKHYPYWGQGRLGAVGSVELFAKTNKDVTIAEQRDGSGRSDTLTIPFGDLMRGLLSNNKPQFPTSTFTLYFDDNSMEDLWLALTWGK
jgi:Tc toxin complex TcA C-terminal TcB-binding domain